jgi:hypothetical protein
VISIAGELNLETSNNAEFICAFSTGADSVLPTSSLSKHYFEGNRAGHINRNAYYSVNPGTYIFNLIIKLDPTPSSVDVGQYLSQIYLSFVPF